MRCSSARARAGTGRDAGGASRPPVHGVSSNLRGPFHEPDSDRRLAGTNPGSGRESPARGRARPLSVPRSIRHPPSVGSHAGNCAATRTLAYAGWCSTRCAMVRRPRASVEWSPPWRPCSAIPTSASPAARGASSRPIERREDQPTVRSTPEEARDEDSHRQSGRDRRCLRGDRSLLWAAGCSPER